MPWLQIGDRIEVDYTKFDILGEQYKLVEGCPMPDSYIKAIEESKSKKYYIA